MTARALFLVHRAVDNGEVGDAVVVEIDLVRLQQEQGEPARSNTTRKRNRHSQTRKGWRWNNTQVVPTSSQQ